MLVNIRAQGFDLTPQLRSFVESRLLGALGSFSARIQSVVAHLQPRLGHAQPEMTSCEIVVRFHPSGEISVRTEHLQIREAIDRAARSIRTAVEREVSRLPAPFPRTGPTAYDRVTIMPADDRISHQQREVFERPVDYLPPVRVREHWKPPSVDDDGLFEELTRKSDPTLETRTPHRPQAF